MFNEYFIMVSKNLIANTNDCKTPLIFQEEMTAATFTYAKQSDDKVAEA